jgi:C-terminal processing protease CtpA/Prc
MSGLFIIAEGKGFDIFKVISVVENSPAADAGIRKGDVIKAINGRKVDKLKLENLRRLFLLEDREYWLRIRRGEETFEFTLKTRRII